MKHPKNKPGFIVGAYVASPCLPGVHSWNPELEKEFFDGLKTFSEIGGLEVPFYGELHLSDSEWFLKNYSPQWISTLTTLPGTMDRLKADPEFGLASPSESGRLAALEFIDQARSTVLQFKHIFCVQLHSAPRQLAEKAAFLKSLKEISSWDWSGVDLCVEHCDAHAKSPQVAKGFLTLEEEMWAVEECNAKSRTRLKILINWGRSAIEGQSAHTPYQHLKQAREKKLLSGLIFSGCSVNDPNYGTWADSHAPFGPTGGSLMTEDRVVSCLKILENEDSFIGFKIQALPKTLTVAERLALVKSSIAVLTRCVQFQNG